MLNLNIDLKARLKNKTFWVGIISTVVLLLSKYNIDLTQYIGVDWQDRLNLVFTLLAMLGITVDTSTAGINDNVTTTIKSTTETSSNNVQAVTRTTIDTSASSKVTVDNPDDIKEIGATVNSTNAVLPN